jgi:tetratricopeptide (TPR) repeat protein
LELEAPGAAERALAAHLIAQTLMLSGRSAESVAAFAAAETLWIAAGLRDQSLAARTGWLDDAQRAGRYAEVLQATAELPAPSPQTPYFGLRLSYARCLALHSLSRLDAAADCLANLIRHFDERDEAPDLVSATIDYATVQHQRGDGRQALRLALRAAELAQGPLRLQFRGRANLLAGRIAMSEGDLGTAAERHAAAAEDFSASGWKRWQANALLETARVYTAVGALDEAYLAISSALRLITAGDAPSRVGAALVALAQVDHRAGDVVRSRQWLRRAAGIYADLDMAYESALVAIARVDAGDTDAQLPELRSLADNGPAPAIQVAHRFAAASRHARAGSWSAVLQVLDDLDATALDAGELVRLASLRASAHAARGDAASALAVLEATLDAMLRWSSATANPLLRHSLSLQLDGLSDAAVAALWAATGGTPAVPTPLTERRTRAFLRRWLASRAAIADLGRGSDRDVDLTPIDRQIARSMLGLAPGLDNEASPARLLDMLGAQRAPTGHDVDALQTALPTTWPPMADGAAFLAYIGGESAGIVVFVDAFGPRIARAPRRSELVALRDELVAAAACPCTPVGSLNDQLAQVAQVLIGPFANSAAPKRLVVDRDGLLAGLPWAAVPWPETGIALLDTTEVVVGGLEAQQALGRPTAIAVIVADRADAPRAPGGALTPLASARVEGERVLAAAPGTRPAILFDMPTRRDVLQAMGHPGGWTHVAAHGVTRGGAFGASGIWIGGLGDTPEMVSWLSLVQQPLNGALLVLNACDLAAPTDAARANMGFALAASRAGTGHVVAALWPVSDAAALGWVERFYASLTQSHARSPALALGDAQRALRDSRRFRHPSHWASLIAIGSY